jgi:hypothetical protein
VADTNPREGFADLFATHPSVQSRVDALVKFAGGHDPGPLAPEEAGGGGRAGISRPIAARALERRRRARRRPF